MMTSSFFAIALYSASAFAFPEQPSLPQGPSPALQIARRVASMENEKDLPSRAVWLGKKVALNSRLASQPQSGRKAKKKHTN